MNPLFALQGINALTAAAQSVKGVFSRKHAAKPAPTSAATFDDELGRAVGQLIRKKDKNGDGMLSRVELGGSPALFAALDTNHDGALSAQELRPMLNQGIAGK